MKVEDYVRTKDGYISKIKELGINIYTDVGCWSEDYVIKSSPNIIDLIEVGDYVNGHRVFDKAPSCVYVENIENKINHIPITRDNLGTVLTKEQFESMEYKI